MADNPHRGSTLDCFLEAEGILAETKARAIEEVAAWRREKLAGRALRTEDLPPEAVRALDEADLSHIDPELDKLMD